jgi:hypothetical protein
MAARQVVCANEREVLFLEQALAMYREMSSRAHAAPDGEVLNTAERIAIQRGRDLTRKAIESVTTAEAQEGEKKGHRAEPVPVPARGTTAAAARGKS